MTILPNLAFAVIFVFGAMAGCVGTGDGSGAQGSGEASPVPSSAPKAEFGDDTGAIKGTVTDPELTPLADAMVSLKEANATTSTAADGSFAFSNVVPGTYTLLVGKLGYGSYAGKVEAKAGQESATVNVQLQPIGVVESYNRMYQYRGYITCSIGMAGVLSEECGQGIQTGGTTGNIGQNPANKIDWIFNLENITNLAEVYMELTWNPASAAAQQLAFNVAHNFTCTPSCGAQKTYCGAFSNFGRPVQHCDILADALSVSKTNAAHQGVPWKITGRAWAAPVPIGTMPNVVLEQAYDMYRTEFFGDPKPEIYTAIK